MFNRQPWEIPTALTSEEIARLSCKTVRSVKITGKRRDWAFYTSPDGEKYWDLSTVDGGFPEKIFDGLLLNDNPEKSLVKIVWFETLQFIEALNSIEPLKDISKDQEICKLYQETALLCRCLELLQDVHIVMPHMAIQIACVSLGFLVGIDPWRLVDISCGYIFKTPLFCLDRRYWFDLLLEYMRHIEKSGELPRMEMTDENIIRTIRQLEHGKITL